MGCSQTIPNLSIYFIALGEGDYADHGSSSDADVSSHEDSDKSVTELRTDVSLLSQVSDPTNKENKKTDKTKGKEPKGCKDITKATPTTQDGIASQPFEIQMFSKLLHCVLISRVEIGLHFVSTGNV